MSLRSSHIALCLIGSLVSANVGFWLSRTDLFRAEGSLFVFVLCNLGLLFFSWLIYTAVSSADQAQRDLHRKLNRLELRVGDTAPETEVLETLSEISVQFLERVQLMPLLKRISEAAKKVLNADVCVLELFTGDEEPVRFLEGTDKISFGTEVHRRVRDQGRSILINNIHHHPRYVATAEQKLTGMVVAPFEIRGKVIGMISVLSYEEGDFSGRDLHLLHVFAQHGALLIEATQLMDAVRRLSLRSDSEEVADLAHLRERLAHERELADYEMGVARRIQVDLLPEDLPSIPNVRLEAYSLPAKEVGGDFYDVIALGGDRWALAIGDVSGKGVPAALVTAMSQTVLHLLAEAEDSPAKILTKLNAMLFRETPPGMFVSMFYGIWDKSAATLRYCNAGHEHPLRFMRRQNACQPIQCEGVALGAVEDAAPFLRDEEIHLDGGDFLLLYTDGVVEAKNEDRKMFGLDRLQQDVERIAAFPRGRNLDRLVDDIDRFVAGAEQHDDITMLSLSVEESG